MKVNGTNYYIGRSQSGISYRTIHTTINETITLETYYERLYINEYISSYVFSDYTYSTSIEYPADAYGKFYTLPSGGMNNAVYRKYLTTDQYGNKKETYDFITIYATGSYSDGHIITDYHSEAETRLYTTAFRRASVTESKNITIISKLSSSTSSHNFV